MESTIKEIDLTALFLLVTKWKKACKNGDTPEVLLEITLLKDYLKRLNQGEIGDSSEEEFKQIFEIS